MEGLSLYAVEMLQQQERINGYIYNWAILDEEKISWLGK
jgi:hypothetical protein